ncbi:ABC transporter substrate-binding protein [Vibrio sp. ZSDE26]|uniref:ABC transporter substrate-binding protein n=1 Tax=Vibrio amylolyticus TaxID=2847292 RepID=A0A9X1XHD3_9VIBR|nr:ABC transporter substrate-binding protein [Vibrio amylolyticus]MCK6261798.1 ABC transporter substrate-binding protein [Vibrio amylolyticus]
MKRYLLASSRALVTIDKPFFISLLFILLLPFTAQSSQTKLKPTEQLSSIYINDIAEFFINSSISLNERKAELDWFQTASSPYKGIKITVISEDIPTHRYESQYLAKIFTQLTGIQVSHEITGEDDLVKRLQLQMTSGLHIYDGYINDSDFIGTHIRSDHVVPLSDFVTNEWKEITLPTLDFDDFIGINFTKDAQGTIYQLPDQQFANLYWYRHDWFSNPEFQDKFKAKYGYELAVPQNWQAYEDIAQFFTVDIKEIDGKRIWGHFDYAKYEPSLGWRISDSWLSLAGVNDVGLPSGLPVGDWGIRAEKCTPVGASVSRGGALNSPAAIYALEKYKFWLENYAPPESKQLTFRTAAQFLSQGSVAQQIFWYSAFVPILLDEKSKVVDENGDPLWRLAPSPRGKYWQEGMKSGYQDAGSWTFLHSTPDKQKEAAWLYAQFTVSKTVSFDKLLNGFTPIRHSDIQSQAFTYMQTRLGGLVEFYQSDAKNVWTPSGVNIPDYSAMAAMWWQHIGEYLYGDISARETLFKLAGKFDQHMQTLSKTSDHQCAPELNMISDPELWLSRLGAPWKEITKEQKGVTLPFSEVYKRWNTDNR